MRSISITTREGLVYVTSIACLAALYFAAHTFVPSCFDDGFSYVVLMGSSPVSASYWRAAAKMYRGFSIPMIYSLFGAYNVYYAQAVVVFQALAAFLSWIVFAMTLAGAITGRRMRWLFFILLASGMFSRGYFAFDDRFLSDSLALSLMLLWLSVIVNPFPLMELVRRRCVRSWLWIFLIVIYVGTAIVASSRDANILLIACCTPIVLLRATRRIAVLTAFTILFACAVQWAFSANRTVFNIGNVIAGVVLPSQERTDYFAAHGLPQSVVSLRSQLPPTMKDRTLREITDDRQVVLHELAVTRNLIFARAWSFVRWRAPIVYASYLVRHPRYVLGNIRESWRLMFDQEYAGSSAFARSLSIVDWLDIRIVVAIAIALSLAAVRHARSDFLMRAGAILAIAGFANAVIAFHGDVWEVSEMARHAWIGSTFLRLGLAVLCFRAASLLGTRFVSAPAAALPR